MEQKIDYSKWKTEKAKVINLQLDPENIRLDISETGQADLINDLFANEDALQIVKSIVEGGLFPDELPIVVKENKDLVVIEGNRRIAALKALINPDIVPFCSDKIKKLTKENNFKPIEEIEIKRAPSKEEALKLLAMKHTTTTRRPWQPLRKAYFYYAQVQGGKTIADLVKTYPNVDVAQFVKMWEIHRIAKSLKYRDDETERKVHDQRSFPISTLERLYNDPSFRNHLGMEFNEHGEVRISSEKKSFENAFTKVVSDIVDKAVTSRTINESKAKKKYLESIPKPVINSAKSSLMTSGNFQPKKPAAAPKNKSLVPSGFNCSSSAGVKRMFEELKNINYNKFPNATIDLMRSLLECGIKAYYVLKGNEIKPNGRRYVYLSDALDTFIDDPSTPTRLKGAASNIRDDDSFYPQNKIFLDGINHNPDLFAIGKDVETAWAKMEAIFRHVLNPV